MQAKVVVEISVKAVDNKYIYNVPNNLIDNIKIGIRVKVPFGNRILEGFVIELGKFECQYELKDIIELIDADVILTDELLMIGRELSKTLLCSETSAYQVMLPKALKASVKTDIKIKKDRFIKLNISEKEAIKYLSNCPYKTQQEIINKLLQTKTIPINKLSSSINTLIKKDIITIEYKEAYRYKLQDNIIKKDINLTEEQQKASTTVINAFNKSETFLLYGVTGSGKTEVYINIIKKALEKGKTALMLVPEISLTTQLVNRLHAHFDSLAVLHSALSEGERYDEYRRIKKGEASLVVGTRSAVFAPLNNIGIIIIDEEQTTSYKQDSNPRYHARDVALMRSKYHNCPLVLGSATPSLESFARSANGIYKLLTLTKRPGKVSMPKVSIIDMRKEAKKGNLIFSDELTYKINTHINNNNQVMILLNRRGYSNYIYCQECGNIEKCPNCDITLSYHKTNNKLMCHYCGYTKFKENTCLICHSKKLKQYGLGTEKLEEEVKKVFQSAKVIRMDQDTTQKKGSHEKIISDFSNNKYNILIGTQMIARGFDFPKLTLSVVINADSSLYMPDFRSGERTYELLSQIAGRSGRSENGEVIIQTFNPSNYIIKYAKEHNYLAFYQYEMALRKKLKYSPYYYITLINIISSSYITGQSEARKIGVYLRNNLDSKSIILGPSMANVFKVNNKYRYQCIIKYQRDNKLQEVLKFIDDMYKTNNKVNIEIDINPLKL